MTLRGFTTIIAAAAACAALAVSLGTGAAPVSAQSARSGVVSVQKDCSVYDGSAGGHCTITTSNLAEIPVSSSIFYDQVAGVPAGLLDSSVVLDAGSGSRAVGRCTLDLAAGLGLCTFSDGTGQLAGFSARVNVSSLGGKMWEWDGTYSFTPLPQQ